ncbi:MAG: NAD(P)/FAD-dependent oxidoreductase [Chlamydiia bacterium]|nr:NAD(P)/FAD-dependent oxidoreductase [Chlamydiia bacterium]
MIYDAIVVGAGPAGGQCARVLAQNGIKTLLIERSSHFTTNNYSTAGAPIELVERFSLPKEVIAAHWNALAFTTPTTHHVWSSSETRGVVFDFAALRRFLANAAQDAGAELRMGWRFSGMEKHSKGFSVSLQCQKSREIETLETRFLIDATGAEHEIIGLNKQNPSRVLAATGIELLVEVSQADYDRYANALNIFFGSQWVEGGYAWVFPMEAPRLKIGIGRYFSKNTQLSTINYQETLKAFADFVLTEPPKRILDKHGKTLYYAFKRRERVFDGQLVAIGDAVSSVNPLALEGIRHAMHSAQMAAEEISHAVKGDHHALNRYKKRMNAYCGMRWRICEWIAKRLYGHSDDRQFEAMFDAMRSWSYREVERFAFHYDLKLCVKLGITWLVHYWKRCLTSVRRKK